MTNNSEMLLTDEMIVKYIQETLGWTVDGTSESNDMIRMAHYATSVYESKLALLESENKRLREEFDSVKHLLSLTTELLPIEGARGNLYKIIKSYLSSSPTTNIENEETK